MKARGTENYELKNHLGNVIATSYSPKFNEGEVSDRLLSSGSNGTITSFSAQVLSYSDYYPFGQMMDGRYATSHRYGFNGMEMDDEIAGQGNSYTAEYWQYDSRLGRRWNVDPMMWQYAWQSPYATFNNNPIYFADPLGLEGDPKTKVNKGEGAFSVAKRNGVTPDALAKANPDVFKNYDSYENKSEYWKNGVKNYMLHPGMELNIPQMIGDVVDVTPIDNKGPVDLSTSDKPYSDVLNRVQQLVNRQEDGLTTEDIIKRGSHVSSGSYDAANKGSKNTFVVNDVDVVCTISYAITSKGASDYPLVKSPVLENIWLDRNTKNHLDGFRIVWYSVKVNHPLNKSGVAQYRMFQLRYPATPEGLREARKAWEHITKYVETQPEKF